AEHCSSSCTISSISERPRRPSRSKHLGQRLPGALTGNWSPHSPQVRSVAMAAELEFLPLATKAKSKNRRTLFQEIILSTHPGPVFEFLNLLHLLALRTLIEDIFTYCAFTSLPSNRPRPVPDSSRKRVRRGPNTFAR